MKQKDILKIFPEIRKLKSKRLRDGVVNTWLSAVKKGRWASLKDVPFTLLAKTKKTLVAHTRDVTQMAVAIAQVRKDLNMDIVIAGGLLHDVGKLLEYKSKGRKVIKSDYGKLVRHPVSGYGLAIEQGLPLEVCHIVAAHSEEGEKVSRSKEAILIHHCDFIDFDIEQAK